MASSSAGRRWVRGLGIVLLVVGLVAAVVAAWGALADDRPRPVGILIGSNLDPAPATLPDDGASTPGTEAPAPSAPIPGWPAAFQGRPPAFGTDGTPPPAEAGDLAEGFYVWSDFAGFHAWLVGDPEGRGTLTVTTDDDMTAELAGGGDAALAVEPDRFTFARGDADGEVVAVAFNPGFFVGELTLDATGDVPVFTGSGATPAALPLSLPYQPEG